MFFLYRYDDIHTTVTGINHFTWITDASCKGVDIMPLYAKLTEKYAETGYDRGGDKNWMNSSFASAERVKIDLFRKYGVIAAAGDRHLAEFMQPWYTRDPETVRSWMFGLTTADWRVEDLAKRMRRSDDLISRHVYNQENTLRVAMTCDRKLGYTTFMNDPQMCNVTPEDGLQLFNDMLENQRKYLPEKWFS